MSYPRTPYCNLDTRSNNTRDFVYHAAEIVSLLVALACAVLMVTKLKSSYQKEIDSFGALHLPTELGALYIAVPCAVLALVRERERGRDWGGGGGGTSSHQSFSCRVWKRGILMCCNFFFEILWFDH